MKTPALITNLGEMHRITEQPTTSNDAKKRMGKNKPFDLVLQLQGDEPLGASVALGLGGRVTAGYCRDEKMGAGFDILLQMDEKEHEVLRVLRLLRSLGIEPDGADLFIGNDSGPAQLAAAVARRSLRIFGPANPHRWAPLDTANHRTLHRKVECSPCGYWECPMDHRCLRGISMDRVMEEAEALLSESPPE